MPDLPGPAKLRQLLIWCTQAWIKSKQQTTVAAKKTAGKKANTNNKTDEINKTDAMIELAERFSNALATHQFNTSWYQRPVSETVYSAYLSLGECEKKKS